MKRWEKILLSLDKLNFATRKQLMRIHDLKGKDNAYRVLRDMEESGLIKSHRHECKIYYLSNKGRERIGSTKDTPAKNLIEHILMRNDLYIYFRCPKTWQNELPLSMRHGMEKVKIVPDAIFHEGNQYYMVEIDRTQTMRKNKKKIDQYEKLKTGFMQQFSKEPILIFYTLTENRKKMIQDYCKGKVKCKAFTINDLK